MDLILVGFSLAAIIGLYFYNNPLAHARGFMLGRFINWFPMGMTYAFLYMGRYNLTVSKNALGTLMTKEDLGVIFAAGTWVYALSFLDGSSTRLGRPWDAVRQWAGWRLGHEYVGLRVVRTARLDGAGGGAGGDPQYVFGWHPHGILILSRMACYGGVFEALFPGIETRVLGATPIFFWPGSREVSLWLGAVDASMATAKRVLAAGLSVIVYPGGSKEIFKTDRRSSETVLELRERTGFVRLAMQHGAPLVPVVVFNERHAYERVDLPTWLRDLCLRTLRVPVLLFYGRFGLLPFRLSLGVVFGAPMAVEHVPDIAKDDPRVAATHARYMDALRKLWEDEKAGFGYGAQDTLLIK